MSDEEEFQYSDDDFDEKKHDKLVEKVLSLNKAQNLKKPSRTEPTLQISEFDLVKSVTGQKGTVRVDQLTKILNTKKKHVQISKRLESTNRKAHTLPKPLEKPQSQKIKRSIGYEKNRFLFDRWEAFVLSNRAQAHQVFPLGSVEKINIENKQAVKFSESWSVKSGLQKELEKLDEVEEFHIEDENNEFPLTLQELKEKRKEAAKLRAHQSYKESKARKQNKIKSKKYHRILRKEKIKQKLKEFEELQKSNPEEALKKLEEIDKARALERFSLRHKSTGQWAKSKQFRAKYDKESRQVLAQQLQISRDLTQKLKHAGSDSEDEGLETEEMSNAYNANIENPWVNGPKPGKEVSEFLSGYKRFWNDHHKNVDDQKLEKDDIQETDTKNIEGNDVDNENGKEEKLDNYSEKTIQDNFQQVQQKVIKDRKEIKKKTNKNKKNKKPNKTNIELCNQPPLKKIKSGGLNNSSGEWDIDDIFNQVEKKMEEKIRKKLKDQKTTKAKSSKITKKSKIKETNKKKHNDLSIPSKSKKQIIDEEMIEMPTTEQESNGIKNDNVENLKSILGEGINSSKKVPLNKKSDQSQNIDPEKFLNPKTTNLDTALPDLMVEDENPEQTSQKNMIMEAFEDNDIVQDFTKEKQEEMEKDKPKDIDLNLPGWGSWAGTGIDPKKQRKRRRFIVKMPEVMPRRDDNKGTLILNEKAAAKIKPHLVSEVPFPFKTVKDYEASIRSPIGNTFVPEIAFRKFIRPAVETKMGTIIEPVTTSILMGKTKR